MASNELAMMRTGSGWQLPLYLAEGTHTYRFVADGKWMTDPANKEQLPNEFGEFNSVLKIGKPYIFQITGYPNEKRSPCQVPSMTGVIMNCSCGRSATDGNSPIRLVRGIMNIATRWTASQ